MKTVKKPYRVKKKHSPKMTTKPSEKEPCIARRITRGLQLSEDILQGEPVVTGYGKERLCIENYHNIMEYNEKRICVQTKRGKLWVEGERLVIAYFREEGMCIVGDIRQISYR
ncbi:MAG: YabP/YqfC family sporulation protein [Lachnospiraceae bacterium]|nr:YabP/YqfC family sporulation protein [Lachnospiraceae bacterium]